MLMNADDADECGWRQVADQQQYWATRCGQLGIVEAGEAVGRLTIVVCVL